MKTLTFMIATFFLLVSGSVEAKMVSNPVGTVVKTSKGNYKIVSVKTPKGKRCRRLDVDSVKAAIQQSSVVMESSGKVKLEYDGEDCYGACPGGNSLCCVIKVKVKATQPDSQ